MPDTTSGDTPRPSRGRRVLRLFFKGSAGLLVLLLLALTLGGLWMQSRFRASLPSLAGERTVAGIEQEVRIERDSLGIPTLHGQNRLDVAFSTGFVHAQDRFFQMDISRRQAAGEVSELFGSITLRLDRTFRIHRFRSVAKKVLANMPASRKQLVESYTAGVNAGLESLEAPPPEYILLRAEPAPWQAEDTVLIVLVMFLLLQDDDGEDETILATMQDLLPPPLFEFLTPLGTPWDAPMRGEALAVAPLPGVAFVDLRQGPPHRPLEAGKEVAPQEVSAADSEAASNAWAVAAERTRDGHALLAVDTHVGLTVPNLWYRATFVWPKADGGRHRVVGATLPGAPVMVIGSNSEVAWGFTNARIDGSDLVRIERHPQDENSYLTAEGSEPFVRHQEVLRTRSGEDEETLEVLTTRWGPLLGDDFAGRPQALRWISYDIEAVNLGFLELETSRTVQQAVELAKRSGLPAQNLILADAAGHIGWTIAGRLPRRVGLDGRLPTSWSAGSRGWQGLLDPEEVPTLIDPPEGLIWTANNRPVGGEELARLGLGGSYVLGARARQIRDRLRALESATSQDMLALQLDDRSFFLDPWRDLLLELLADGALAEAPRRRDFRQQVEAWNGHAAIDSVGYRLIRETRDEVARRAINPLLAACYAVDEDFEYLEDYKQIEGPLWALVSERPSHLLDPQYATWDELLLAAVDTVLDKALNAPTEAEGGTGEEQERLLTDYTWGQRNTTDIRHFFSLALPFLGRWLDMPKEPLPGDRYVPRVQGPNNGASLRMVVAPGREEEGMFHMPGGQSGHFLSPHYGDSHPAWARGEATPLLPGETINTFLLSPPQ